MKRQIKICFSDGSSRLLDLIGFSTLPNTMKPSLSINPAKGGYYLCVSESLIPDFSKVERLEIVREGGV